VQNSVACFIKNAGFFDTPWLRYGLQPSGLGGSPSGITHGSSSGERSRQTFFFCFVFPRPKKSCSGSFSYHINLRFICTSTLLVRDFSDRQLCAFDLIDLSLYRCLQPGASFVIFFTHPFLTFPAIEYSQKKKAIEKENKCRNGQPMEIFDVTLCHDSATECHCHLGPRKVKLALLACTYGAAENSHVLSLSRVIACLKKMVVRITFSNTFDPYKIL
jgi:hypothetical protein